jgi:hypothetical protein
LPQEHFHSLAPPVNSILSSPPSSIMNSS